MRDKYKLSPALPVQEGWSIAICPHKLAAARLVIYDAEGNKASVLYDPEGKLHDDEGCWEVHPYGEDVAVLALDDIEGLTEVIQAALQQQKPLDLEEEVELETEHKSESGAPKHKEYVPYLARAYRWLPVTERQESLSVSQMLTGHLESIKECLEAGSFIPHEFLQCEPEETLTAQLWIEVIEYELARRAPKRGIWWLAVDRTELNFLLKYEFAVDDSWREVEHMHVTLAFNATEKEVPSLCNGGWESSSFPILVKGLAYNSKCACLVVDIGDTDCCNKHPHITLAPAEGVQPVYSNDMLEGKDGPYTYLPLEATLEGQLEFKPFD